jgi:hypothetical protein
MNKPEGKKTTIRRYLIQHNDIQLNGLFAKLMTLGINDIQHNDTQHISKFWVLLR